MEVVHCAPLGQAVSGDAVQAVLGVVVLAVRLRPDGVRGVTNRCSGVDQPIFLGLASSIQNGVNGSQIGLIIFIQYPGGG
jgi:hypothetical protein